MPPLPLFPLVVVISACEFPSSDAWGGDAVVVVPRCCRCLLCRLLVIPFIVSVLLSLLLVPTHPSFVIVPRSPSPSSPFSSLSPRVVHCSTPPPLMLSPRCCRNPVFVGFLVVRCPRVSTCKHLRGETRSGSGAVCVFLVGFIVAVVIVPPLRLFSLVSSTRDPLGVAAGEVRSGAGAVDGGGSGGLQRSWVSYREPHIPYGWGGGVFCGRVGHGSSGVGTCCYQ
jgi:hypothetical protein